MSWLRRKWFYRERRCARRWCLRRRWWVSAVYCERHAREWFARELAALD